MTTSAFLPVDEQLQLLERGAVDLVERQQLRQKLERSSTTGVPLTVKVGFDPSTPDLHLGHTVLLRKMRHFQDLGHRVIFLIGDFTGMIGDPTGKKTTRPQLTREEVAANAETYKQQVFRILDVDTTVIDYNSNWLSELGSEGLIRLAGSYTLARMMERDDFRERYRTNQPISLHELLYPLCQGYDSIALQADVELGGHDQLLNLLVGRDLMKARDMEPQIVLTVPLLVGTDGVDKMSKSLGNSIAFADTPREIYGGVMSIPDSLMWDWLLLLTDEPETGIATERQAVEDGELHPKRVKERLARIITADAHGEAAARAAADEFERVFARKDRPDDIPTAQMESPCRLTRALTANGLASSNKEAQRLIRQGAVTLDGDRAEDAFLELAPRGTPYELKVGKRRFLNLTVR